jgi:hypothetical protein
MKRALGISLIIATGAAGMALAQPSPPDPNKSPDAGSGAAPEAGSGGEQTLPPEHLGGTDTTSTSAGTPPLTSRTHPTTPTTTSPQGNEPLVLDTLRVGSNERLELYMFGGINAIAFDQDRATVYPAFVTDELGLLITAHLATGLIGRMESALSYNDQFGTNIDMERAYIEYRKNGFVVAGGRTHAELGYWNNAFHHGKWLQLTIDRPRVLRFEDSGGMLPVHQVGVTVEHGPDRGESGLDVVLAISNGHGPTLLGIQTNGDDNLAKALLLRIGGVGFAHDTLRFGVNAMVDRIRDDVFTNAAGMTVPVYPLLPNASMTELITGAYLALRSDTLSVFSEVYNVLHVGGGKSWDTTDGFAVVGYRIGNYIPYGLLEARYGDGGSDPFYNPDPEAAPEATGATNNIEVIAGLKYELSPWCAFKFELGARHLGGNQTGANQGVDEMPLIDSTNEYRAQVNWSFGR